MSSPSPPDYQRLYRAVIEYIDYNRAILDGMDQLALDDEALVIQAFKNVFQFVYEEFEKKKDLSRVDVKRISNKALSKVSRIFKSRLYREHGDYFHEKYTFLFHYLRQELKAFEKIIPHKEELEGHTLDDFLDTSWGWKQLGQLAKINDPWALQTIRKHIANNNPKIFLFLIKNADFENLHPLIFEFKDHPELTRQLDFLLQQETVKERKKAYQFIEAILSKMDWEWGQKAIESRYKNDQLAERSLRNIFEIQRDPNHFINQFMLEQLFQDSKLGIDMFAQIFSCPSQKASCLIKPLIEMAKIKKSIYFDLLLLAMAVLSYSKNGLIKEVKEVFKDLESQHQLPIGHYQNILHHLFNKIKELWADAPMVLGETSQYKKANYTVARAFQLFGLREHELILFLMNNRVYTAPNIEPTCECFPLIQALIVGSRDTKIYFPRAISQILSPHQVTVYYPLQPDVKEVTNPSSFLQPLESSIKLSRWLQDSSFIARQGNNNFFQYPYWADIDLDVIKMKLRQRLSLTNPGKYAELNMEKHYLNVMGRVSQDCSQLDTFKFIINTSGANTALIDYHQFQFTYNEGGNCIIGSDHNGPYALIGKDAMDLNREILAKELAALGFNKNEKGLWEQKEPYSYEKLTLSDDDLKFFFARDLKISDPSRIHFIEQADYHLDMVMSLVGERKVILNDSILAYQQLENEILINAQARGKSIDPSDRTRVRLAMLLQEAKKNKFLEDAAAFDLEKNGFKVKRVAGIFADITQDEPANHRTNLFNYLSMTTPTNKRVIIALGCSQVYQEHFKNMILPHVENGVDEIYFLDQDQSEALLVDNGGVHCLTKYLPRPL